MSNLCEFEVIIELESPDMLCMPEHFLETNKLDILRLNGFPLFLHLSYYFWKGFDLWLFAQNIESYSDIILMLI